MGYPSPVGTVGLLSKTLLPGWSCVCPGVRRTPNVIVCLLLAALLLLSIGCVSDPPVHLPSECASLSSTSLTHYDKYSAEFLNDKTKYPPWNLDGEVVWGTRYYLESLLTAYEATQNPKYLQAFEDSGKWVMGKTQTMTFVDVPDPSAPGKSVSGPTITLTGWPTNMAALGVPVAIPTATKEVSLYAQSLYPTTSVGASSLNISRQTNGTLEFEWTRGGKTLQSYTISSIQNLNSIASTPLVYGQSPGRIAVTGVGLPAVGTYEVDTPLTTIWDAEQTSGILLSFVHFLLIAKNEPQLVDANLVSSWQSKVLTIASEVAGQLASDRRGGYVVHNGSWMASTEAGTPAESDYVWVEISLRILLYELTGDPSELSLARGILQHQLSQNLPVNVKGWLVVRDWPDIQPWSNHADAPVGSIWDVLSYDPHTPETSTDGGFFVEMLHFANSYGLVTTLAIPDSLFTDQSDTFHNYLLIPNAIGLGLQSPTRLTYPTIDSAVSDPVVVSDNPFAETLYLMPESSSAEDWQANWQWMLSEGTSPNGWPIGYFLRAWARSEAAFAEACKMSAAN